MLIVDNVLGNIHTNELLGFEVQAKQKTGHAEHVEISFHDAQRRRLRLTMSTGTEVGINLTDRGCPEFRGTSVAAVMFRRLRAHLRMGGDGPGDVAVEGVT